MKDVILLMGPDSDEKDDYTNSKRKESYTIVIDEPTLTDSIKKLRKQLVKPLTVIDTIYIKHPFLTMQSRFQVTRAIKQSGVKCNLEVMIFDTMLYPYELGKTANIYHYQGGDENVVLVNRSNHHEPIPSSTVGNHDNPVHSQRIKLVSVRLPKIKDVKNLEFLLRLRERLERRRMDKFLKRQVKRITLLFKRGISWTGFTT